MANFGIKLNLALLNNVKYAKNGKEKFIIIPVKDNYIWEGTKGLYLSLVARELQNPQYEQTHMITLNIPDDVYKKLSEVERKHTPILGNVKPIISKQFADTIKKNQEADLSVYDFLSTPSPVTPSQPHTQSTVYSTAEVEQGDDLPF